VVGLCAGMFAYTHSPVPSLSMLTACRVIFFIIFIISAGSFRICIKRKCLCTRRREITRPAPTDRAGFYPPIGDVIAEICVRSPNLEFPSRCTAIAEQRVIAIEFIGGINSHSALTCRETAPPSLDSIRGYRGAGSRFHVSIDNIASYVKRTRM